MKRIGDLLKETRKSQNLSLEDIAQSTKIHINKLRAIEEHDYDNLPSKVFIKGLIRSYARELKIDKDVVTELCDQEFSESQQLPQPAPVSTPAIEDEDDDKRSVGRFQAPSSFFVFLGVVVVVVLVLFIYATVSKIQFAAWSR